MSQKVQQSLEARRAIYAAEFKNEHIKYELLKALDDEEVGLLSAFEISIKMLAVYVKKAEET